MPFEPYKWAKSFAATHCSSLSDKQHGRLVDGLEKLLKEAYAEGKRATTGKKSKKRVDTTRTTH